MSWNELFWLMILMFCYLGRNAAQLGGMRQQVPPDRCFLSLKLYGATAKKTAVFICAVNWHVIGFNGIVLSGALVSILVAPAAGNLYS